MFDGCDSQNDATKIVVGFGFHTAIPNEKFPTVSTFHTLTNRELPIVFVKLDKYTGTQISTDADKQNIVPFTECVNEKRLTVNGTHYMRWQLPLILAYSITTHKSQSMTAHNGIVYEPSKNKPFARGLPYVALSRATDIEKVALLLSIRPDHFINKSFTAENIKITEFYNNLKKLFNNNNNDEEI
jgi:hypothetical protein